MNTAPVRERRAIAVRGIVQGVGFRPFVYALARRHGLTGMVRNDATGVYVEVEGPGEELQNFLVAIRQEAPPLAVVEELTWQHQQPQGGDHFAILESREGQQRHALISPDVTICAQCLSEVGNPSDRRFRYPFINCTDCGPRFTIIQSVPYDRASTTMASFIMCHPCRQEYEDPSNRRFHAQPNACPDCGPSLALLNAANEPVVLPAGADPIAYTAKLLCSGAIVAVKGLGGYHLACDPFNEDAVRRLRARKVRADKPFALMAIDIAQVRAICFVDAAEEALLRSPARPIVLLRRHPEGAGGPRVHLLAPGQSTLGVMLAYTPLHYLLLHDMQGPLVMTSANRSDEPIAYRDEEAMERLGGIADYFLVHNRPIHMRCDDSVVRVVEDAIYPVRRSRGYAPAPLALSRPVASHTLGCGGELKTTFCLARDRHAFLSHHIGDLENYETLRSYKEGIAHYCRLFDITPHVIGCDLHPAYLSTQYARELEEDGLPVIGVQHHHAHIASCLAENDRPCDERVIGVALDGTGYGTDGTVWGGEFLVGSIDEGFSRRAHLATVPMPGGEAAVREPWRMAIAYLLAIYGEAETLALPLSLFQNVGERQVRVLSGMIRAGINAPLTSSAGRLFDAVAALVGMPGARRTSYEGQAAIELEAVAQSIDSRRYPFNLNESDDGWIVETRSIIDAVVEDLRSYRTSAQISATFHRTIVEIVVAGCRRLRDEGGPAAVALSGGTFGNMLLLRGATARLREEGFHLYLHRRVPSNDGGLSLGQAILADSTYRQRN